MSRNGGIQGAHDEKNPLPGSRSESGGKGLCPALILCDYNLSGPMNGVESIKSLRAALARNPPAIVMTGDTREKTMQVVAPHGLSVLVKPFPADELIQLMKRLCSSSASPGRNRSVRPVGQMATRG